MVRATSGTSLGVFLRGGGNWDGGFPVGSSEEWYFMALPFCNGKYDLGKNKISEKKTYE